MGAWIEIATIFFDIVALYGRTPRWVRGLKYVTFLKLIRCLNFVAPHDGCVD